MMSSLSEQKNLERERLVSLVNSMADAVIAIDEDQKIAVYNGAALNILDVNGDIDGKTLDSVLALQDSNNHKINISKIISDCKIPTSNRDWKLQYPDGSNISLYTSIAPVRLGYGKQGMRGHVILLRDISREKSLEEERNEFISVVSHELRTPIAIAEGNISNAQLIYEKSQLNDTNLEEALSQAHDQIVFLAGMMNDLATLSRAERGKLALDIESVQPIKLLQELVDLYRGEAKAKNIKLQLDSSSQIEQLKTGRLYLREILQNFITNAIKYTESGEIKVGAQETQNGVKFYVSDTGIGISKPDQEKVFDKFFRSEDYRTRKNNGTGLGLYVTLKLARIIHADIDLESELNKGSTFYISAPDLGP